MHRTAARRLLTGSILALAVALAPATSASAATTEPEAVDLIAGETPTLTVAPGAAFDGTLLVTNASDVVVRGVAVAGEVDFALEPLAQHANCRTEARWVSCVFPQHLQPGTAYRATLPFRLRSDAAAPATFGTDLQWMTAADHAKLAGTRGVPGAGGKLRLEPTAPVDEPILSPVGPRAGQTDTNPGDNFQSIGVRSTGVQGVDIVALGATASGAAGETVTATVGVRNDGPATLDRSRVGEPATAAVVTVPPGATVTTVPAGCHLIQGGNIGAGPDAVQYLCSTDDVHRAGETVSWSFALRLDTATPNATGAVVANPVCDCSFYTRDTDRSNDRALIVLNPAPADETAATPDRRR